MKILAFALAWSALCAEPAARVTGRVVIGADLTAELIGYYTHIEGFQAPLFAGEPTEKAAYFAFRTERSPVQATKDGDAVKLTPRAPESILSVYYHPLPDRDFAKPESFTEAQLVATFRAREGEATLNADGRFSYTGKIKLDTSSDFVIEGVRYNFSDFGAEFTLDASGSSPGIDEIAKQASSGNFAIPFTGSAAAAGATESTQRQQPQSNRSR